MAHTPAMKYHLSLLAGMHSLICAHLFDNRDFVDADKDLLRQQNEIADRMQEALGR